MARYKEFLSNTGRDGDWLGTYRYEEAAVSKFDVNNFGGFHPLAHLIKLSSWWLFSMTGLPHPNILVTDLKHPNAKVTGN